MCFSYLKNILYQFCVVIVPSLQNCEGIWYAEEIKE